MSNSQRPAGQVPAVSLGRFFGSALPSPPCQEGEKVTGPGSPAGFHSQVELELPVSCLQHDTGLALMKVQLLELLCLFLVAIWAFAGPASSPHSP